MLVILSPNLKVEQLQLTIWFLCVLNVIYLWVTITQFHNFQMRSQKQTPIQSNTIHIYLYYSFYGIHTSFKGHQSQWTIWNWIALNHRLYRWPLHQLRSAHRLAASRRSALMLSSVVVLLVVRGFQGASIQVAVLCPIRLGPTLCCCRCCCCRRRRRSWCRIRQGWGTVMLVVLMVVKVWVLLHLSRCRCRVVGVVVSSVVLWILWVLVCAMEPLLWLLRVLCSTDL